MITVYNENDFLRILEISFKNYKIKGERSNTKLKPIHKYLADILCNIWGEQFKIHYLGDNSKELEVEGKYYPKRIDITVTDNQKPIFCFGIKFVTSNYKQNANNYFENMMGETANIQATKDIPYAQLIILRHKTPYYKKNNSTKRDHVEIINDKDIQKYFNLIFDTPQLHRPYFLGVFIININESKKKIERTNLEKNFKKEICNLLQHKVSLQNLFSDISTYKNYYLSRKSNG